MRQPPTSMLLILSSPARLWEPLAGVCSPSPTSRRDDKQPQPGCSWGSQLCAPCYLPPCPSWNELTLPSFVFIWWIKILSSWHTLIIGVSKDCSYLFDKLALISLFAFYGRYSQTPPPPLPRSPRLQPQDPGLPGSWLLYIYWHASFSTESC